MAVRIGLACRFVTDWVDLKVKNMSFLAKFAAAASFLVLAGCNTIPAPRLVDPLIAQLKNPTGDVLVIGHRGCWATAPENSLAAIEACIALGVDMAEIDIQRSADGELVLMHDLSVDRTTNGSGAVADLELSQLRTLRLRADKGGSDRVLTDQKVPTLREAMEVARGRILLNIDAKADVYADVSKLLVSMNMADQVLMKMPAAPDDPRLRASPLMRQAHFMPVIVEGAGHGPIDTLLPGYSDLTPVAYEIVFENRPYFEAGLTAMRASGRRIWVNTLLPRHAAGHTDSVALSDPGAHWGRLVGEGVNMIQTDEPRALIGYLCQVKKRTKCPS
jgi:glycerophosphoryl diester phosphodiesterase